MPIGWFNSDIFQGPQIFAWFFIFAFGIFIVAKVLSLVLENITNRVKVSKVFMGGIVMSMVTSIPELFSSIFGAVNDDPLFAIYNETGSNSFQIFILSFVMVVFFLLSKRSKQKKTKTISEIYEQSLVKISKQNEVLIVLLVVFYALFVLFTSIKPIGQYLYIPVWNISIISIVPFVFWLVFCIWTLVKKDIGVVEEKHQSKFNKVNMPLMYLIFGVLSASLAWIAYVNSEVVDTMSDYYKIPTQSAASILLSIPTALPEGLTMIFLFRRKQYTLGFSTLVGSGLTNSSFMFYVDNIYRKPIMVAFFDDFLNKTGDDVRISAARMQYWIPLVLCIYLLLWLSKSKHVVKSNCLITTCLSSIVLIYIIGFGLISSLVF